MEILDVHFGLVEGLICLFVWNFSAGISGVLAVSESWRFLILRGWLGLCFSDFAKFGLVKPLQMLLIMLGHGLILIILTIGLFPVTRRHSVNIALITWCWSSHRVARPEAFGIVVIVLFKVLWIMVSFLGVDVFFHLFMISIWMIVALADAILVILVVWISLAVIIILFIIVFFFIISIIVVVFVMIHIVFNIMKDNVTLSRIRV